MGKSVNERVVLSESARGRKLSEVLSLSHDLHLDLLCGGRGTCGRCKVLLESGTFEISGKILEVSSQTSANACQTKLLGKKGVVSIPHSSLVPRHGQISSDLDSMPKPAAGEAILAVDIGTTTVVAAVLRHDGTKTAACYNQQLKYGDNVAARISFASESPGNLEKLRRTIVDDTLNQLLAELGNLDDVVRVAISGNTVMTLLFFGISPESLGAMPFIPPCRIFPRLTAGELGLALKPEIPVFAMPAIAAYVGGDLTAGILETHLGSSGDVELLVDMGTNCEIVLAVAEKMYCTAAAAGPAFEGAGIQCGCRATPGAIDHIYPDWNCSVIGDPPPKGLCGSAMIDFLAEAKTQGFLNELGRLDLDKLKSVGRYRALGSIHAFRISGELLLSEADIEQLLKAKAAVCAGIHTLLAKCGLTVKDVKRVYLAGGFAKYLNLENAVEIGLLPELPNGEYLIAGNTSLAGAARLALQPRYLDECIAVIDKPQNVHLNSIPEFESNYIDALLLA